MFKKSLVICACAMFIVSAAFGIICNGNKIKIVEVNGMVPVVTEKELILNSELIVRGTVIELSDAKWSNPDLEEGKRNILQTDVIVKVDEVISGEYSKDKVTVRMDKGFDDKKKVLVKSDGYPDFTEGESAILFLSSDDSDIATDEDCYVLTGMKNGKITENEVKNKFKINSENDTVSELKEKIVKEKADNPNWKEDKEQKEVKTIENNKRLFGE